MLKINDILNNYKEFETELDDRFGKRFVCFLNIEQMEIIGFKLKDEHKETWQPKEWNEENVINQLKEDIEFGLEKAHDQRGISSSLMFAVVKSWLKVLEDEETLVYFGEDYFDYGVNAFEKAKEKYITQ